jgi:hypothetical protein
MLKFRIYECVILTILFLSSEVWSLITSQQHTTNNPTISSNANLHLDGFDEKPNPLFCDPSSTLQTRRDVIQNSVTISKAILTSISNPSFADAEFSLTNTATDLQRQVDLDCLRDLPPIPVDCVRIYFCRHGQTENNRLRKVQGARIDPPINDSGKQQSTNMGRALERAKDKPELISTSPLLRARMTADIISKEVNGEKYNLPTKPLDSLKEIDFGPFAENQPIRLVQERMTQAYATWSIGNIDYRPQGGGNSGREVCCIVFL